MGCHFFHDAIMPKTKAITEEIEVSVEAFYIPEQSDAHRGTHRFAYHIRLRNLGQRTVQLLRRHWVITDSNGKVSEVKGEGVVGKTPVLTPGESFEYISGSALESPMGVMEGSYSMQDADGVTFEVRIPAFTLASPVTLN